MASSKGNFKYIKDNELKFSSLMKDYLLENELFSYFQVIVSIIISLIVISIISCFGLYYKVQELYNIIITTGIGVFAVIIAAFGIFAAITDKEFYKDIYRVGEIGNILFPFWFNAVLWVVSILITTIFLFLFFAKQISYFYIKIMIFIAVLLVVLNIGYTLSVIGDMIKFTIRKVQISIMKEDSKLSDSIQECIEPDEEANIRRYKNFLWIEYPISVVFILTIVFLKKLILISNIIEIILGGLWISIIYISVRFLKVLKEKKQYKLLSKVNCVFKLELVIIGLILCIVYV